MWQKSGYIGNLSRDSLNSYVPLDLITPLKVEHLSRLPLI
jgi:hypothetical protein